MDGSRFDALARSLTTTGSRRGALRALLTGALGLLGAQHAEDATAHDALKTCKKLDNKAKKKKCVKKAKKHNATHTVPIAPPGPCAGQPDDAPCNGDGRCRNGACNPRPTCGPTGTECGGNHSRCCSGRCIVAPLNTWACNFGPDGTACLTGADCASERCVGYRCLQGTKADGQVCNGFVDGEDCASDQCGCTGSGVNSQCTCRRATCVDFGATCFPDPLAGDDGSLNCCQGRCAENSLTHQFQCVDE